CTWACSHHLRSGPDRTSVFLPAGIFLAAGGLLAAGAGFVREKAAGRKGTPVNGRWFLGGGMEMAASHAKWGEQAGMRRGLNGSGSVLLDGALQRMLVLAGEVHHLGHLGLGDLVGEDAA